MLIRKHHTPGAEPSSVLQYRGGPITVAEYASVRVLTFVPCLLQRSMLRSCSGTWLIGP